MITLGTRTRIRRVTRTIQTHLTRVIRWDYVLQTTESRTTVRSRRNDSGKGTLVVFSYTKQTTSWSTVPSPKHNVDEEEQACFVMERQWHPPMERIFQWKPLKRAMLLPVESTKRIVGPVETRCATTLQKYIAHTFITSILSSFCLCTEMGLCGCDKQRAHQPEDAGTTFRCEEKNRSSIRHTYY